MRPGLRLPTPEEMARYSKPARGREPKSVTLRTRSTTNSASQNKPIGTPARPLSVPPHLFVCEGCYSRSKKRLPALPNHDACAARLALRSQLPAD